MDRVWEALKPHHEAIAEEARRAPVNYIDERAWYPHGALWTLWWQQGPSPPATAPRARRFAVLWRRTIQGTYNAKGDRGVERILSVRETWRLRGVPSFPVLVDAVSCYFNGQHPNVSWI